MALEESITRPLVSIASLIIHVHDHFYMLLSQWFGMACCLYPQAIVRSGLPTPAMLDRQCSLFVLHPWTPKIVFMATLMEWWSPLRLVQEVLPRRLARDNEHIRHLISQLVTWMWIWISLIAQIWLLAVLALRHDSPAAGEHQVDITTPKAISAGVLRATVRWITKAVWHGSVGMVRFGGQHVCAALSPR
ncbi:hypothetical protein BU15DRAFT_66830 [Melanogaster broomeanus]|nr:hypothetical protein BU15DRAFT_66830 [Melanogaster broomeanus]